MLRQILRRTATAAPSRLLSTPVFRSSFTSRFLTTEAATTQTSTPPPSSTANSTSTSYAPAKQLRQLPYLVERTHSKNLSVYNDTRAGGTKKATVVKKIVGDSHALKAEIVAELGFPEDEVKINPVTGHIKIKGFHEEKVKDWLLARGF